MDRGRKKEMSRTKAVVETINASVDRIKPSPYQPRLTFNLEDIRGSIQRDGILVPLTVRKKEGYYELIDGERRLRLAKELEYRTVPVTVIEVDEDTARRMVWKVNTLRQEYMPKEKAYYFKKLQEEHGMSLRGIAREYDQSPQIVLAYLNVFKLPEEYQQMVWDEIMPIRVIRVLEPLFSGVARATPKSNPEIFEHLDRVARSKHYGAEQIEEAMKPYLTKLREEEIEKAKKAVAEVKPEVKVPTTPEELERAAKALRREAKRKREETLTPKEKARIEAEKKRRDEERRKRAEERKRREEEALKKRLETEKKRIEDETREKVEQELLADEKFLRKAAELAPLPSLEVEKEALPKLEEMKPEELQEVRKRWERLQEDINEILARPEVKERGELFMNWLAHGAFVKSLGSARCPICLKESIACDWKNLVWKCHNLNLEKAYKIASGEYQKSMRRDKG